MAKQKLEQVFVTTGADQAAANTDKVSQAIEEVAEATKKLQQAEADQAVEAGKSSDKTGALTRRFTGLVATLVSVVVWVKKVAAAIGLMGTGGVALKSVRAMLSTWQELRQEMEAALGAARALHALQRREEERTEDARKAVVDVASRAGIQIKDEAELANKTKQVVDFTNLGIGLSRAAGAAVGTEFISEVELTQRRLFEGPGARRGEAGEQARKYKEEAEGYIFDLWESFKRSFADPRTMKSLLRERNIVPEGKQGALRDLIQKQVGTTPEETDTLIEAMYRFQQAQKDAEIFQIDLFGRIQQRPERARQALGLEETQFQQFMKLIGDLHLIADTGGVAADMGEAARELKDMSKLAREAQAATAVAEDNRTKRVIRQGRSVRVEGNK